METPQASVVSEAARRRPQRQRRGGGMRSRLGRPPRALAVAATFAFAFLLLLLLPAGADAAIPRIIHVSKKLVLRATRIIS